MPSEILINDKLSDKEKIILSMIIYLSRDKGYCFATNNYFSDILNVTKYIKNNKFCKEKELYKNKYEL